MRAGEPADVAALRAAVRAMTVQRNAAAPISTRNDHSIAAAIGACARVDEPAAIGADKRKADAPAAPSARPAPEVYRPLRVLGKDDRIAITRAMAATSRTGYRHLQHMHNLGLWDYDTWYPATLELVDDHSPVADAPIDALRADRVVYSPIDRLLVLAQISPPLGTQGFTHPNAGDAVTRTYARQRLRNVDLNASYLLDQTTYVLYRDRPGVCHAVVLGRLIAATRERRVAWRAAAEAALPLPYSQWTECLNAHVNTVLLYGAQACVRRRALERAEACHARLLASYARERPLIHAEAHRSGIPLDTWLFPSLYSIDPMPREVNDPLAYYQQHRHQLLREPNKLHQTMPTFWERMPAIVPADVRERLRRTPRGWILAEMIAGAADPNDLMPLLERSIAAALAEAEDPEALTTARAPMLPK